MNKHIKSCRIVHKEIIAKSKLCFSQIFQFSETDGVYVTMCVCVHVHECFRKRGVHERVGHVYVCVTHG